MSPILQRARALLVALALVPPIDAIAAEAPGAKPAEAGRIVAAGAAATEILWDLGMADAIVGVDTTSSFPPEALKTKPNVGYFRKLSAEGLLSLKPTMIVAVAGAGPREVLDLVGQTGVRIVAIEESYTPEGVATRIEAIGAAVGRKDQAAALAARTRQGFDALATTRAALPRHPRVLFLIGLVNGRPMAAGRGTAADAMIGLAGGVNATTSFDGYKPLTDEAVIEAAPDVVVTMANGAEPLDADRVFGLAAFAATPAARDKRLVSMDGGDLLAFGPRTPEIATRLMQRLAPR
jgi:iron complex transport system substrate-binding protein